METIRQLEHSSGRLLLTLGKPEGGNYCLANSHPLGSSGRPPPVRVFRTTLSRSGCPADPTRPTSPGRVVQMTLTQPGRPDNPHPAGLSGRPPPGRVARTTHTRSSCPDNPHLAGSCGRLSSEWFVQKSHPGDMLFFDSGLPPMSRQTLSTLNLSHQLHWVLPRMIGLPLQA